MAGVTQLVSSVSGGNQQAIGSHGAENAALGVFPPSIVRWSIGAHRIGDPSRSGWALNLALAPRDFDAGLLHFTPSLRPITSVGGADTASFGRLEIEAPDSIRPHGIEPPSFSPKLVAPAGAILSLNLSTAPRNQLALQMSWGDDLLTSVGGSDSQAFGGHRIETFLSAEPDGWESQKLGFARATSGAAGNLLLNFDDAMRHQNVSISFTFGGALLLMQAGADSARLGAPGLEKQDGARPHGIDALSVGLSRVHNASLAGGNMVFNLTEVKTQTGANVAMTFGYEGSKGAKPDGWDSMGLGPPALIDNKRVNPAAINSLVVGTPDASHFIRTVVPSPLISLRVGVGVEVENLSKGLLNITLGSQLRFGDPPEIANRTRYVTASSTAPRNGYGAPRVEHDARYLYGAGAIFATGYNTHWISRSPRTLETAGIWPPEPLHNHIVGFERSIEARGWDSQTFGTRIRPDDQRAYPAGFKGGVGEPRAWNWDSHVKLVHQAPHTQFGAWEVWNLRQIARPFFEENKEYWATVSTKNAVANRNRVLGATGTRMDKFGYTDIRLGARVLHPGGVDTFTTAQWYEPMTMAAYRIRSVLFSGLDSFTMSRYHGVINAARAPKAPGWDSAVFGGHTAWKPDRTYYQISAGDQQRIGRAFIADAVREIKLEPHQAIPLPYQGTPKIELRTRYVTPVGVGSLKVSTPGAREQRNIIKTHWGYDPIYWHGQPTVRNLTPELGTWQFDSQRFGAGMIRTEWRNVYPEGWRADQHSKQGIRDRRTWTTPTGIAPIAVPPPQVHKFGGMPEVQRAFPVGFALPQVGGGAQVPPPSMNQWVIRPDEGIDALKVPNNHDVWSGGLTIESGIFGHYFGDAWVSLKIRSVSPQGLNERDNQVIPKVRVSPHTIYAVFESSAQAKTNHPTNANLHYIDHDKDFNTRLTGPGRPAISLRHRVVKAQGLNANGMSSQRIYNAKTWVYPTPWPSPKYGWHKLMPFTETAEQFESQSFAVVGAHEVARPPYTGPQTVKPNGLNAQQFPIKHWISNWVQEKAAQGFDSMTLGSSRPPDTRYMWQTLHVGPPEKPPMDGFDSMGFGEAWISNWVRELQAEGVDAFECEYDLTRFEDRMRVYRVEDEPQPIGVAPVGFEATHYGQPDLRPTVHHILPDGNAEQYRKGAP